jgi:hypothetical protein
MTTERSGQSPTVCAVNKTKLIACGGGSGLGSSCEMLDLTNQGGWWKWSIPGMITARFDVSGILLPDSKTFLVTGGRDINGNNLLSCEKLDIAANTWSSAGNLLGFRYYHTSVLFNNSAVVMGGRDQNGAFLNTCEQFNSTSNTWSSFPSFFSTARYHFGAAVVLNKIYIAGGRNGTSPDDSSRLSSVEVYSGTSWSLLPSSLAQTRYYCAAVAFQNKLVVLGGHDRTTIEVFDPVTSTWSTTFPPMKISPTRPYLAAVSF